MDYKLYNTIKEIEVLGKSDIQVRKELYDLWRECFGDTKEYTDFYFSWKVKDNRVVSIYKQERLSSMLHLNPYMVKLCKKTERLNYIVGVATRTEDRRQGLMKLLLETTLNQMYEEQMPFTYLMPAAEAIYHPFGFRIVYNQAPWKQRLLQAGNRIGRDADSNPAAGSMKVIRVTEDNEEAMAVLTDFTGQYLSQNYDIYAERSPYYYKRLIREMESGKGGVLLCILEEEPVGYISYMTDGGLGIAECIYRSEHEELFFNTVGSQIVDETIQEPKADEHRTPSIMVRIVDFQAFTENLTAGDDFTLTFKVEDPIIQANNGVYLLTFTKKGCKTARTQKEPDLVGDIAQLTSLFFGRLSKTEMAGLCPSSGDTDVLEKLGSIHFYKKVFINDVV